MWLYFRYAGAIRRGFCGFALLLALASGGAAAQTLVRGTVRDAQGNPLELAVVVLVNPRDSSIVAHTAAGRSGAFALEGALRGEYWLQVHMVGYATARRTLAVPCAEGLAIVLQEEAQGIEAVRIAARKRGTKVEGQTVKYNIAAFLTGSERTLGDLLKALPGLKVAQDGTVTAQGETVSKILFNGQDLYGGNVGLATKNVDAAVADSVRVVHGYSEYSLYGGFKNSDETVIDVGVKRGMMDRLNGRAEAGGGYRNLYSAKGNAMYIGTEDMFSVMAAGNNTGEQSFTYEDLLTFIGGIEHRSDYAKVPDDLWDLIYPSMDTYSIETGMVALNYNHHRAKTLKVKTGWLGTWGNRDAESRSVYETLIGPRRGAITETARRGHDRVRALYGMGAVSYTPADEWLCGGTMNLAVNRSWGRGIYRDFFRGEAPTTRTARESTPFSLTGAAFASVKLGRHLVESEVSYRHHHEATAYDIVAERVYLPLDLSPRDGMYQFALPVESRMQGVKAKLGSKLRLTDRHFVELELRNQWEQLAYENRVEAEGGFASRTGYRNAIGNEATLATNDCYVSASWNRNRGFFQAKVGGELHALHYRFRQGRGSDREGVKWFATPVVRLKLEFAPMHTLRLKARVKPRVLDTRMQLEGDWDLDYRRLTQGGEGMKVLSLEPSVELRYRYFSDQHNLRMRGHARYTRTQLVEREQALEGQLRIQRPVGLGQGHKVDCGFWVGKTLWAFWEMGMYTQYAFSAREQLYRSERVQNSSQRLGLYPDVRTTYKFPLNVAFGGQWQYVANRYGEMPWVGDQLFSGFLELDFKLGDWRAKLETTYEQSQAGRGVGVSQWNLNASAEYTLWWNLTVGLVGRNLLNLDRREWQEVDYGSLYRTERMFRTIPGFVVAKLGWEFGKQPARGRRRH